MIAIFRFYFFLVGGRFIWMEVFILSLRRVSMKRTYWIVPKIIFRYNEFIFDWNEPGLSTVIFTLLIISDFIPKGQARLFLSFFSILVFLLHQKINSTKINSNRNIHNYRRKNLLCFETLFSISTDVYAKEPKEFHLTSLLLLWRFLRTYSTECSFVLQVRSFNSMICLRVYIMWKTIHWKFTVIYKRKNKDIVLIFYFCCRSFFF